MAPSRLPVALLVIHFASAGRFPIPSFLLNPPSPIYSPVEEPDDGDVGFVNLFGVKELLKDHYGDPAELLKEYLKYTVALDFKGTLSVEDVADRRNLTLLEELDRAVHEQSGERALRILRSRGAQVADLQTTRDVYHALLKHLVVSERAFDRGRSPQLFETFEAVTNEVWTLSEMIGKDRKFIDMTLGEKRLAGLLVWMPAVHKLRYHALRRAILEEAGTLRHVADEWTIALLLWEIHFGHDPAHDKGASIGSLLYLINDKDNFIMQNYKPVSPKSSVVHMGKLLACKIVGVPADDLEVHMALLDATIESAMLDRLLEAGRLPMASAALAKEYVKYLVAANYRGVLAQEANPDLDRSDVDKLRAIDRGMHAINRARAERILEAIGVEAGAIKGTRGMYRALLTHLVAVEGAFDKGRDPAFFKLFDSTADEVWSLYKTLGKKRSILAMVLQSGEKMPAVEKQVHHMMRLAILEEAGSLRYASDEWTIALLLCLASFSKEATVEMKDAATTDLHYLVNDRDLTAMTLYKPAKPDSETVRTAKSLACEIGNVAESEREAAMEALAMTLEISMGPRMD